MSCDIQNATGTLLHKISSMKYIHILGLFTIIKSYFKYFVISINFDQKMFWSAFELSCGKIKIISIATSTIQGGVHDKHHTRYKYSDDSMKNTVKLHVLFTSHK